MSEWRTIDTAPKDGTRVLVCTNGQIAIAWWNERPNVWNEPAVPCWTEFEPEDYFYAVHLTDEFAPTHWMPLPEPPHREG